MKRTKLFVVLILSLLFGAVHVGAEEEGWKPKEAFFVEHEAQCTVENREYHANGPNGQVIVYQNPVSPDVVHTLENGETVLIDYVYTNDKGVTWGFCEIVGEFGWLPMPYMVPVYDYTDFEAEYGDQFVMEKSGLVVYVDYGVNEELRDRYIEFSAGSKRVIFWRYPGSSNKITIRLDDWAKYIPQYTKTFVDEEGRKWGFVGYYMGENLNRWVCISTVSQMLADFEELYPNGAPERDKREITPYEGEEIFPDVSEEYYQQQNMQKIKMIAIVVGIGVIIVAAIIFYSILWKKVKRA